MKLSKIKEFELYQIYACIEDVPQLGMYVDGIKKGDYIAILGISNNYDEWY